MLKVYSKIIFFLSLLSIFISNIAIAEEQFQNFEIRVIKQRYFQKTNRIEIGPEFAAIMNNAFVYTWLGGGHLGFHFSESIGLIGEASFGYTMNKSDCEVLGQKFHIDALTPDLKYYGGALLAYTPVYGKYQMTSGDVLYFDWFFLLGGGMAGMALRQESCIPDGKIDTNIDTKVKSTPQLTLGTGQRFAVDKNLSLNWNIRLMEVKAVDASEEDSKSIIPAKIDNVLISLGIGYFL